MGDLSISLFGKFSIQSGGKPRELEAQKAEELLAYLLIYRQRPHFREKLATLLWPNSTLSQSKGYLRQSLWQIHSTLDKDNGLLQIESDWIRIEESNNFWLDVAEFEKTFHGVQDQKGKELDASQVEALKVAVAFHQADLLENWYQDWCLFERERLQNLYLGMLGKLVGYYENLEQYESGIIYALKILKCDRAHERTYRRLMRLYYQAGDRSSALRTYERCTIILRDELDVSPSQRTQNLFKLIKNDQLPNDESISPPLAKDTTTNNALTRLLRLRQSLIDAQWQLDREIEAVRLSFQR